MRWRPGRDPRAERHPGPIGTPRSSQPYRVAIVGGGIAGLAAATGLAERGVAVTVVEREAQLGGRVRAWPVEIAGSTTTMSRGFHAFFRQYYNLRTLLRRADPTLAGLRPLADYPLIRADGHTDSFARVPRTPPLNVAGFVALSPSFGLSDLAQVDVGAAVGLLDVDFPQTFHDLDGLSAADYLDRLRFPERARHLALEVFARSFFADPRDFAAGELVAMLHAYFVGSSEGLLFDVPNDDFDTALWRPLADYLTRLGVTFLTGTSIGALAAEPDRVLVGTGDNPAEAYDAVVLAAGPAGTARLVEASAGLDPCWRRRVAETSTAPPFAVWRLWLDRRPLPTRAPFLGTSGFGPLDNISILDAYESGAGDWASASGGSVVELHGYALPAGSSEDAVRGELRAALETIYPELAGAVVVGEQWLVETDCPLPGLTGWVDRPGVTTPDARIMLAGDQVNCDFPVALMERAATTGWQAANTLLAGWGVRGHDVWTVPTRSRQPRLVTALRCLDGLRPQPGKSPRRRSA